MVLKKTKLGNTDVEVSRIGLGCMSMSGAYGPASDDESMRTIHRALELGCNFLDTADIYGNGHNEELVGRAIQNRCEDVFLATKFGLTSHTTVNAKPDYVRAACERSLNRVIL